MKKFSLPGTATALLLFSFVCLPALPLRADNSGPTPEEMRSPVNQVFQWMQEGQFSGWSDGSTSKAIAYLWIPEKCRKVRGLLILGNNVPEQMLSGHADIRQVCTDNDLGIVFCTPSFYNFKKELRNESQKDVAFLQQLLDGLAKKSGYDEVSTVPWLPIGESGHLLMVDALMENAPERCIAGIWLKNPHLPPKNRTTPALVIFGSAQEWGQDHPDKDIRTIWNDVTGFYNGSVIGQLKAAPSWPLSFTIDGWSGHFDCSEKIVRLVARYIDAIAKARLSTDGSPALRPVDIDQGYRADIPVPGHQDAPAKLNRDVTADLRGVPWFPDRDLAAEAQALARINWNAQTQFPCFINGKGERFPYTFNGISRITMNHAPKPSPDGTTPPVLESEPDGITFTLRGELLDKIPNGFGAAGAPLAQAPGPCVTEWLSGCIEPLGNSRFRIALDRTWPSPLYIGVRHAGNDEIRGIFQPGQIDRAFNTDGKPQKITFDPIADVKNGTATVPLTAKSDSGLPVHYFVVMGPAIIQGDKLVFRPIPPRAAYPLAVTVAAWQGGCYVEPKVQQAAIARQTFHILAP